MPWFNAKFKPVGVQLLASIEIIAFQIGIFNGISSFILVYILVNLCYVDCSASTESVSSKCRTMLHKLNGFLTCSWFISLLQSFSVEIVDAEPFYWIYNFLYSVNTQIYTMFVILNTKTNYLICSLIYS